MMRSRRRRDPYTRTVVRLPDRSLAESVLQVAAPLLEDSAPLEDARRVIELAVDVWNAHVAASKLWGDSRPKALADLRRSMRGTEDVFRLLSEGWRAEFMFDPRLVGAWSYDATEGGARTLVCETLLPDGVEAHVPPPLEKRIAIGGAFLDEVRIRQSETSYLSFPVENHRGVIDTEGVATVRAQMPTVAQLFAEGRLAAIGGHPVEVRIGATNLGPMVLRELRCGGDSGRNDVAVLVFARAADHPGSAT
jgi:hypothetical protein